MNRIKPARMPRCTTIVWLPSNDASRTTSQSQLATEKKKIKTANKNPLNTKQHISSPKPPLNISTVLNKTHPIDNATKYGQGLGFTK